MNGVSKYSSFTPAGSSSWIAGLLPNWQGGTFDGWRHAKSVYAVDFANARAMNDGSGALVETSVTAMRASPAYLEGDDGIYRKFGINQLAMMDATGVFIGGQVTNRIHNPRGDGGVVGTVGVTNKCAGYNAAPPVLVPMGTAAAFNSAVPRMSTSGGDGATLYGVVDDTAALQAIAAADPFIQSGLDNGWLNGRVYKVDNSAGAAHAYVDVSGATGNTNTHTVSFYSRGFESGFFGLVTSSGAERSGINFSAGYTKVSVTLTPGSSDRNFQVRVSAGSTAYFILFDLIEASAAASVPTVVAGASATGALPSLGHLSLLQITTGISTSFLGASSENGLPTFDVRYSGMALGTGAAQYYPDGTTNAATSSAQAWGGDIGVQVIAGTAPDVSLRLGQYNSGGIYLGVLDTSTFNYVAVGGGKVTFTNKGVATDATVASVKVFLQMVTVDATVYDFTLRIFAPKLVQICDNDGTPGYLPTFPILPPVGVPGDSVRYGDVVRAITDDTQPFSRWVAAGLDEGGSAIVSLTLSHVGDGAMRSLFEISDGSVDNYVRAFLDEDDRVTFEIVAGRIVQASVALALPVAVGPTSIICTWTADGGYICDDNGQMTCFTGVALPVDLAQMQLGGSLAATYLDDAMRQIQVCLPLTQSEATFWVQMI
jgi:hypothetical protein